MISLARYAALLEPREMRQTLAVSMLGRVPIGITGLAVLLLVQTATESFFQGGAATGCYVIGLAAFAPALGRIIDRHGPRLTLLGCGVAFPAALVALVLAVEARVHPSAILACAAAAGATFPPITVCMRSYFRQRLTDEALLSAAYSVESVLIELVFIIGPLLVALFIFVAHPPQRCSSPQPAVAQALCSSYAARRYAHGASSRAPKHRSSVRWPSQASFDSWR